MLRWLSNLSFCLFSINMKMDFYDFARFFLIGDNSLLFESSKSSTFDEAGQASGWLSLEEEKLLGFDAWVI